MPSPVLDSVTGTLELDPIAIDKDLTTIGWIETHQDVHQGRFASSVLAKERMNFPMPDREINPIVGDYAGKALNDPAHLDRQGHLR